MKHATSDEDRKFARQVESCEYPISEFNHRAHLRLAFVYLVEHGAEAATEKMRDSLIRYIRHNEVPLSKYHETLTRAWILAVRYFLNRTDGSSSADELIDRHPEMLDPDIMMIHYSAKLLFSDKARNEFVHPDLEPIPHT